MRKWTLFGTTVLLACLQAVPAQALVSSVDDALNLTVPAIEIDTGTVGASAGGPLEPQFEAIMEFAPPGADPGALSWRIGAYRKADDVRAAPTVNADLDITIPYLEYAGSAWRLTLGLVADSGNPPPEGSWKLGTLFEAAQSNEPRDATGDAPRQDTAALARDVNRFAVDLYQEVKRQQASSRSVGNFFCSPYSISQAMAMVYAGARNDTSAQMAAALHFSLPGDRLHEAFNTLDLELAGRGEGQAGVELVTGLPLFNDGFRLTVANSVWAARDNPLLALLRQSFRPEYLDLLAEYYGDGIRFADFYDNREGARKEINKWMNYKTRGMMPVFLPQGSIDRETRLLLTNAIYFNAAWELPFDPLITGRELFHTLDGATTGVDMMSQLNAFAGYAAGEGYQAVDLPYAGGDLSMVILLPANGRFSSFESGLDAATLNAILASLGPMAVSLRMPRWEDTSSFDLKEALQALGMTALFADGADLSGIETTRRLFVGGVVHKAFIAVSESGTEAGAGSFVYPYVLEIEDVTVDRPFIYIIRDVPTGLILFIGRVVNPAQ